MRPREKTSKENLLLYVDVMPRVIEMNPFLSIDKSNRGHLENETCKGMCAEGNSWFYGTAAQDKAKMNSMGKRQLPLNGVLSTAALVCI